MSQRETIYFQCGLRRTVDGVTAVQNSYLPERYANTGRIVGLKNAAGEWEEGWEVVAGRLPGEEGRRLDFLIQMDRQAKKTRDASDI